MSHIVIDNQRCKGCLLCTTVCPRQLIRQSALINQQGYKIAEVPEEKREDCTACASCALICPDVAIQVWKAKKGARHGG